MTDMFFCKENNDKCALCCLEHLHLLCGFGSRISRIMYSVLGFLAVYISALCFYPASMKTLTYLGGKSKKVKFLEPILQLLTY